MSELPSTWITAPLKECANINMGQSPEGKYVSENKHGLPFYQGKAEFGKTYPTPRKYCIQPTKIAQQNDILLSIRAPVGPTNLCPEESCIGRGLASIRAHESLHQQYLLRYFKHIEPWLSQQGTGSTFKAISGGFLSDVEVVIAPLNEQIRIADKLDSVLAKVDAAQTRLEKIPTLLKRFRQSVLAAAVSGELTEEWRKTSAFGTKLVKDSKTIADICLVITDGEHITPPITTEGIPLLSAKDIRDGYIDFSNPKYVSEAFAEQSWKRCNPSPGDCLIVSRGATVGRISPVNLETRFCLMGSVILLRPNLNLVTSGFLRFFLCAIDTQKELRLSSGATAQAAIYLRDVKMLKIKLPPLEEQTEIVRRIESLFTLADTVEKQYLETKKRIDRLTQSLLAKAFRGELVPQDPNDEPAAELLKRIQAERNAQPPVKNKRAKSA